MSLSHNPSRLQILVAQRPGGADDVKDDELFGEGELDAFLRSDGEVEGLREVFGWTEGIEVEEEAEPSQKTGKGQKGRTKKSGTKRVNMDALARVLQADPSSEDKDDMEHFAIDINDAAGLEEIEEWRPLSPDASAHYDSMDLYDEEH